MPCQEYLKLICDEDGNLNRRLFYDNVRDFQGHNAVNQEIEETVKDARRSDRFALLNNGVTIVAGGLSRVGDAFTLRNYQIVNGCQTSHILHLNRERLTESVYLPLKLIVTDNVEVTNQIIQGTNRQTEVQIEAFESLAPFQKKLEELYLAVGQRRANRVYYERRSKQYDHVSPSEKYQIITLAAQINCFVGMFLNEPHSTHRYYGELLNQYRGRLFSDAHAAVPYYVAGLSQSTIERLFSRGDLSGDLRRFRYQVLMVFRLMNELGSLPRLDENKIETYCDGLISILDDEERSKEEFRRAGQIVLDTRGTVANPSGEPMERTRAFTNALIEAVGRHREATPSIASTIAKPATATRVFGSVKWFSDTKRFGFITDDEGEDLFVHRARVVGNQALSEGLRVEFTPIVTRRGLQAIDVQLVK